jgi:putative nucleotidyltransferase with HDIG domain
MAETATAPIAVFRPRQLLTLITDRLPLPPAAAAFWVAVVAPAAAASYFALHRLPAGGWNRFAVLALAASLAQMSAVHMTRRRVFHPAIVFVIAGILVLSPEQLVLMCVLQHLPEWLKQRYAWYIQTFNIANYVVAALAGYAATRMLVGPSSGASTRTAIAGVVAASCFVLANRCLLAPMLRLARGMSLRATRLFDPDDIGLEYVLALMGVPVAAVWATSLPLAALTLAPLVLIQITQRAMQHVEVASETIQTQNGALEDASRLVVERSMAALEALSATVDARDTYTAGHSRRVRDYAMAIGAELGLATEELDMLSQAAMLHDIGKIAVPDSVLLKEGKLETAEWIVMKSHAEEGARIIERLGYLDEVVPAIRHHHERPDGRGYPAGLRGNEIPVPARIIHVADALDAITTTRVYRGAVGLADALEQIRRGRGTDFCTDCVSALERAVATGAVTETGHLEASVAA